MDPLAHELATLSAGEMVSALGAGRAPALLRRGLALPFFSASRPLGETLAELDHGILAQGLPLSAARALQRFGVELRYSGDALGSGPLLLLGNHPGAYDALGLMSAIARKDLLILAADRGFLRALPRLSEHLVFVGQTPSQRAGALKRAVSALRRGGAVLHFPAGEIEPDADFEGDAGRLLSRWQPGVAALLRACAKVDGRVALAGVRGVHSPRAKLWAVNRWAERRGITTLSPLLQIVARLRDVVTRVRLDDGGPAQAYAQLSNEAQIGELRERLRRAILRA